MQKKAPTRKKILAPKPVEIDAVIQALAQFRYRLRCFHRFSEQAARSCGITPQQHQLMLGVAGFTGRGSASISELAEFLQEQRHSVVGLVERAVQNGLVRRTEHPADRRVVVVSLSPLGKRILTKLSKLHQREIQNIPLVLNGVVLNDIGAEQALSSGGELVVSSGD